MITELMDRFAEFTTTWLWLVMLAAWRAFPILVLVLAIGLALRRKLTPSLKSLLLTIVIVRLLIPISISSPTSLHKPIDQWFSWQSVESENQHRLMIAHDHASPVLPNVDRPVVRDAPAQAQEPTTRTHSYSPIETFCLAALLSVIAVSMALLLRSILSHVRFVMRLRYCRLLDDPRLIDMVLRECDSLAVGRRPALREVQTLAAPAVFGLVRQTICLPAGLTESLSEQELRWVIRHELAHIRRRDILVVMVASIAGAFHWFNPMVWMIVSRLRAAMEAAADRLAVQNLTQSEVSAYGDLLLRFAQDSITAKKSPTLGLISFASGKHLKQRVKLLMCERRPNSLPAQCLSAGLVVAMALAGLTDATQALDQPWPKIHLVSGDSTELAVPAMWFEPLSDQEAGGPTFTKTYDLDAIFETVPTWIRAETELEKRTPWEWLTTCIPLPPSIKEKLHVDGATLTADLTAREHQFLKQTLDIWKDGEPGQITIETRLIQTNLRTASSIEWSDRRIDGLTVRGHGPAIAARIDEPALARLIRSVSEERNGNILYAPKVTVYDGQTASLADQVKRPFVTDLAAKADGRVQPVVSVLKEGLSFVLTTKSGNDGSVNLDFKVTASSIGKVSYANLPIRTQNDQGPQFTVQVPATEQYEVSSSVKLAAGESIVVAIPRVFENKPGADAETTMIVALTPRIIGRLTE